jgi:hypothetical protein
MWCLAAIVLTNGFTHLSQLHRGSRVARPIVTSPSFAGSIFPFSNVRISSGEESTFFLHAGQLLLSRYIIVIMLIRGSLKQTNHRKTKYVFQIRETLHIFDFQ